MHKSFFDYKYISNRLIVDTLMNKFSILQRSECPPIPEKTKIVVRTKYNLYI